MDYQEILARLRGIDETISYLDELCQNWKITKKQFQLSVLKLKSERKKIVSELVQSSKLDNREQHISDNLRFLKEQSVLSDSLVQKFISEDLGDAVQEKKSEIKESTIEKKESVVKEIEPKEIVSEKIEKSTNDDFDFECSECGKGIRETDEVCLHCGNIFESSESEKSVTEKSKDFEYTKSDLSFEYTSIKPTNNLLDVNLQNNEVEEVEIMETMDDMGTVFEEIGPHTMMPGTSITVNYDQEEKGTISMPGREFLEGFLYEFNINWMHYLGAFLVVVSSLFLVISSWSNFGPYFKSIVFILYSLFFTVLGYVFMTKINIRKTGVTFQMIGYLIAIINFSLLNLYDLPVFVLAIAYVILLAESYFITLCFNRKYAKNHIMSCFLLFLIQAFWVVLGQFAMPLLMVAVLCLTGSIFYYGKNIVLKYDTEELKNFSIYNLFFASFSIICITITGYASFQEFQFAALMCFLAAPFVISGIYLSDLGKRLYEGKTIEFMYLSKTGITGYIILTLGFLFSVKVAHWDYGVLHISTMLAFATAFFLFYISLKLFKELSFFYFAYFASIELVFYLIVNKFVIDFQTLTKYPVIAGYIMIPIFLFWHRYVTSAKELLNKKIYNHSKMLLAVFACITFLTGFAKPIYNWPLFAILGIIFCKYGLANISERFTYFGLVSCGFSVIYLSQFLGGNKEWQLLGISIVSLCYILIGSKAPSEKWELNFGKVISNCSLIFSVYFILRYLNLADIAGSGSGAAGIGFITQLIYIVSSLINGFAFFKTGLVTKEAMLKVIGLVQFPALAFYLIFISGFSNKALNFKVIIAVLIYQYFLIFYSAYFYRKELESGKDISQSVNYSILINSLFHIVIAMFLGYGIWLIPSFLPGLLLSYYCCKYKSIIYSTSFYVCLWVASIISFTTEWSYTAIFLKGVITPFLPLMALLWFGLSRTVEGDTRSAFVKVANSILSLTVVFIVLGVVNISIDRAFDVRLFKYLLAGSILQYFFLFYILVYTPKKDLMLEVEYSGKIYAFSGLFFIADVLFHMMYQASKVPGGTANCYKMAVVAYVVFIFGLVFKYVFKKCHNDDIREYFVQAFFFYSVIFSVLAVFISSLSTALLTILVAPIPLLITYFSMYEKKVVEYIFLFIFDALMTIWIFQMFASQGNMINLTENGFFGAIAVNFLFFLLLHIWFPGAGDIAGESPHRRFGILAGVATCIVSLIAYIYLTANLYAGPGVSAAVNVENLLFKFAFFNLIAFAAAMLSHYYCNISVSNLFAGMTSYFLTFAVSILIFKLTHIGILIHLILFSIFMLSIMAFEKSSFFIQKGFKPLNLVAGAWCVFAIGLMLSGKILLTVNYALVSIVLILYAMRNRNSTHSYLGYSAMLYSFLLLISTFGSGSSSSSTFFTPGIQFCISLFFLTLTIILFKFVGNGKKFSYYSLINFKSTSDNSILDYIVQPGLTFSILGNLIVIAVLLISSASFPYTISISTKIFLILASLLSFANYLVLAHIFESETLVWIAEGVLAMSLLAFRKFLFTGGVLGQYKTFIILLASFLMFGLSILLKKAKQSIYVNPFSKTSLYMPVVVVFLALSDPSFKNIIAVFVASLFYSLISHLNKNKRIFSVAVLFFNLGIWGILYKNGITNVSYYLIPFGIVALMVLELNKNVIKVKDLKTYRSIASTLIYLSGSFQMYESMSLKGSLLVFGFSLAGILLGVFLKVKLYLYIGSGFMILTVISNLIFFSLKYTMIWWILGTLTGLGLIAVTSFLDKKRQEYDSIQNWIDSELKGWE